MGNRDIDWSKFYRQAGKRLALITSATQYETADGCLRKWYALKRLRLPEARSMAKGRGDVIHNVCQRFNEIDDQGNGPEMFGKDWHIIRDSEGRIEYEASPAEQSIIRTLIKTAIDEGILVRHPRRSAELEAWVPVMDTADVLVKAIGFIDLHIPGSITDYKSTKDMKWALSPKKLRDSIQMRLYAKYELDSLRIAGKKPKSIDCTHIYFCVNPDKLKVRKVVADPPLTPDEIDGFFENKLVPLTYKMVALAEGKQPDLTDTHAWFKIPGPQAGAQVCRKYGGCPFLEICGGRETPQQYKEKVGRIIRQGLDSRHSPKNEDQKQMGVFNKPGVRSLSTAVTSSPAEAPAEAPAETPAAAPAEAPAAATEGAPWADPACGACEGKGFNSKGGPCKICTSTSKTRGTFAAMMFAIRVDDEGAAHWIPKDDAAGEMLDAMGCTNPTGSVQVFTVEPPKVEEKTQAPVQEAVKAAATSAAPSLEITEDKSKLKKPRGRQEKTFILCLFCTPQLNGTSKKIIYLDQLIQTYGEELAEALGSESYWMVDAFKRREFLANAAAKISPTLKGATVVVRTQTADSRALTEAFLPFATEVYGALAQ